MGNHDDLSLDELRALIETRLKEFLNRRPAPSQVLDLILNFMQVIYFAIYDAELELTAEEDMAKEGYFKDGKGRFVKDDRILTEKGGDKDEGKDR